MIKDTLTLYKELIATGVSPEAAEVQAKQLGATTDFCVRFEESANDQFARFETSISDKFAKIDERFIKMETSFNEKFIKLDKDMLWMRAIGALIAASVLATYFAR